MTHDDEYESEWVEVPATGPGAVSDDTLGRHLLRRGAGTVPSDLAATIATRIADSAQESGWRRTARALRPVAAIAAVLVVVLMGSLIAIAPRPGVDSGPGSTTLDPATRPMTVAELVRYYPSGRAAGSTVIVDDDIAALTISCPTVESCPIGVLSGFAAATDSQSNTSSWVFPADPSVGPIGSSISGPVALRIRSGGGFTYLGRVAPASSTRLAWSVADARDAATSDEVVVHGWLGGSGLEPPCPAPIGTPDVGPTSIDGSPLDFGCGELAYIAATSTVTDTTLPAGAIRIQNGAYVAFGTNHASSGAPEPLLEGDYLLRRIDDRFSCTVQPDGSAEGSPVPCDVQPLRQFVGRELVARLDPVTIPAVTAATPSPTPTPTPAGATWDPTQRPLTPPEFLRVMARSPAPGTVLIVDDLVMPSAIDCATNVDCPTGALVNATGTLVEPPPGGIMPFATDGYISQPIPGPIALQVTDGPYLVFLGTVVNGGLRLTVSAHDLAARNATGGLFVVPAWIGASSQQPTCPSTAPMPEPTSELGLPPPYSDCVPWNWLTDTEADTLPSDGFAIQPFAYRSFAPDPAENGHGGMVPRQGIFLVRDWAGHGEVLARLEPRAIPTDATVPTPGIDATPTSIVTTPTSVVTPPPSQQPTDSGPASPVGTIVWPKDELVRRALAGTISSGTVVVADLQESDFTPFWPPDAVHSCPQHCSEWNLNGADGSKVPVLVSMLSLAPASHVGRVAFLVEGNSLRLLGPVDAQADGHPQDVSGVPTAAGNLVAVHGWLRDGLPVPCPAEPSPVPVLGLDQIPLTYTCPGTWIQPTPAEPATTNADGSGTVGMPVGAALVQDGADGSNQTAREGIYLIRRIDCSYPAFDGCQAILDRLDRAELIGEVTAPDQ